MNITIIGTGYVGLVTGTCFAEMGNTVTCVDMDREKIDNLNKGIISIYEPGLEKLIQENQNAGRLIFSTSLKEVMEDSNLFLIAVGTPESPNGEANMEYVYAVASEIGEHLIQKSVIVNKSTVPVGTAEKVKSIIDEGLKKRGVKVKFHVVSNPEFLKEGDAIRDFMRPDRVIIGTDSKYALDMLKQLYSPFTMNHDRLITMGMKEAVLTKYAANAMLATKISFINEIAHICDEPLLSRKNIIFSINPSIEESNLNRSYLNSIDIPLKQKNQYVAPIYDKKEIIDYKLLKILETQKEKPKFILINLGSGVQERLGSYLKDNLSYSPALICTGVAIAFLTGAQASMPEWVDRAYLGWLSRIVQNPKIFTMRYINAFRLIYIFYLEKKGLLK